MKYNNHKLNKKIEEIPLNWKFNGQILLNPNFNYLIQGHNLSIRTIKRTDINQKYVDWLNNKKTNRFLEAKFIKQTEESITKYINKMRFEGGDMFGIFYKNKFIGTSGISNVDNNNKRIIYGMMIGDENARILGFGAEATILVVELFLNKLNYHRIWGGIISENKKAINLIEKLGFKKEGVFRDHSRSKNGYNDMFFYGLLQDEWNINKKKFSIIINNISFEELS